MKLLVDVRCDGSLSGKGAAAQVHWCWPGGRTYSGAAIEAHASKTKMHTYYKCFGHLSNTYTMRCTRCLAWCRLIKTALFGPNTADDDHKDKHETGSNISGNAGRC